MKLVSMRCDSCGASLDVGVKASYVTCTYCGTELRVHHTGNSHFTETLKALADKTDAIAEDVAALKRVKRVEEIDREWEMRRKELVIIGENGNEFVPTKTAGILAPAFLIVFAILWMSFAGSMDAPVIFPLFGLVFIGAAIVMGVTTFKKAEAYQREHALYEKRRKEASSTDS